MKRMALLTFADCCLRRRLSYSALHCYLLWLCSKRLVACLLWIAFAARLRWFFCYGFWVMKRFSSRLAQGGYWGLVCAGATDQPPITLTTPPLGRNLPMWSYCCCY
ncbi:hypothetical protein KCP73_16405 [Salmonella enterica subsp. enterica]|nr:hypothetical protein KCP73_16405 [Salmonella enterica subsp. enterica]